MKPAPICYLEIPAPEVEKLASFYKTVFAWHISQSELTSKKYYMFKAGDSELIGGLDSTKNVVEGGVIFYINVDNIEESLENVTKLGGSILKEKRAIAPGYGYAATFKDPCGNHVGLWARE